MTLYRAQNLSRLTVRAALDRISPLLRCSGTSSNSNISKRIVTTTTTHLFTGQFQTPYSSKSGISQLNQSTTPAAFPSLEGPSLPARADSDDIVNYLLKMSQTKKQHSTLKISIEGNIASGKSSIIEYLRRKFHSTQPGVAINTSSSSSSISSESRPVLSESRRHHSNIEHPLEQVLSKRAEQLSASHGVGATGAHSKQQQQQQQQQDTIVDFLEQPNVHMKIITEPVDLWRNLNGNNLLDLMYTDPHKWAFPFHSYVQLTMLENHMQLNTGAAAAVSPIATAAANPAAATNAPSITTNSSCARVDFNINIMERSLYSAKYCFVENIFNSNILKPVEYEILDKWFHFMTQSYDCNLDIIFYLRTRPETCLQRLRARGRPEEADAVSIDYLRQLHDYHEQWLVSGATTAAAGSAAYYRPQSVIVIDADQSIDDVYRTIEHETRVAATVAF